jgi:hypothetical protein
MLCPGSLMVNFMNRDILNSVKEAVKTSNSTGVMKFTLNTISVEKNELRWYEYNNKTGKMEPHNKIYEAPGGTKY